MNRQAAFACVLGLSLILAAADRPASGALLIQLDCGSGPEQSGWTKVTSATNFRDGTAVDLGGGVTGGLGDDYGTGSYDRGSAGDFAGQGLDDVVRDFCQLSTSADWDRNKVMIKGLPDGVYDVTVYGLDPSYDYESSTWLIGYMDSVAPVSGGNTISGTSSASTGPDAAGHSLDLLRETVQVTLSKGTADNAIALQQDGGFRKVNGLVVELVPEPATMSLLALGLLPLLRRKRK